MSDQRAAGPLPETVGAGPPFPPANVLLIDQPDNLPALEGMLAGLDLNLVCATSADDALLQIDRQDFAVVLLNVRLAGGGGFETARQIRGRPRGRGLPIIFLRPAGDSEFHAELAYTLGAVDYLEEPFLPVIVRAKVAIFVHLFHDKEQMRRLERETVEGRLAEERLRAEADQERRHAEELARLNRELESAVANGRRVEAALLEADRHKDQFLSMLAHEMRNPLAPLRNALTLLRLRGDDPTVREQGRAMAERQVTQLTRFLDDLLDLARIRQGKLVLKQEPADLVEVAARAVETVRPTVEERRHRLEMNLPAGPVPIVADPVRLQQVIVNLMTNACRYTDMGGVIRLSVTQSDNEALVSVRDTGIGLASDMLPRIFELYAQANRAAEQGGLGIGLTLVRGLVASHGGSVQAFSDGPGRGSEFVVRLPLAARLEERPLPAEPDRPEEPPSRGLKVLIVEDNEDAATSLDFLLRAWGHETRAAANGPEALAAARSFQPGVAFVDIGLPGMDGYEVGRQLLQETAGELMLVAMTGYGAEGHRRQSRECGFHYHLVKPVDPEALHDLLVRFAAQ
jgi:signal transduction histidine kinase